MHKEVRRNNCKGCYNNNVVVQATRRRGIVVVGNLEFQLFLPRRSININPFKSIMEDVEVARETDSETEIDCEGFFLEPSACTTSISERIAEANRQLFEESAEDIEDDDRPRKVQFSAELLEFAPDNPNIYTDDGEYLSNNSEDEANEPENQPTEDDEPHEDPLKEHEEDPEQELDENDVIIPNEPSETGSKLLLVLLPREQSSSCESIIGDEDVEEEKPEIKKEIIEKVDQKVRPKSANKSRKNQEKVECKMMTVSPELDCTVELEQKNWHESVKVKLKNKGESRKIGSKNFEDFERPVSSQSEGRAKVIPVLRPKTAPTKRPCCVTRNDLPRYNGYRSEYGLSAEQLKERKLKNAESRYQRKVERQTRQEEDEKKKTENEIKFSTWLEEKSVKPKSTGTANKKDTLVRSDIYIQKNAVYASKCGVPYAVDYTFARPKSKLSVIRKKTLDLGKLFDSISPHAQRTYQIYVGSKH